MKTILISFFGFITALFFSYRKGASNQKEKQERKNDKEKIRILETKEANRDYVASLSNNDVDNKLSKFFSSTKK